MVELKTLKDFETNDESIELLFKLRAEAVKWMKGYYEIRTLFRETDGELFMNFFNLTEEDLK